jgi:hypothetical protein
MSVVEQTMRARRRASIVRDGDDYVATDRELGVMMRHQSADDLRKACLWLQWDIEDANVLPRWSDASEQRLASG